MFDRNIVQSNQSYFSYLVPYLDSTTAPQGKAVESMLCISWTFLRCSEGFRIDFDYRNEMIYLIYIMSMTYFGNRCVRKVAKTNMRQSVGFPLGLDKVQTPRHFRKEGFCQHMLA